MNVSKPLAAQSNMLYSTEKWEADFIYANRTANTTKIVPKCIIALWREDIEKKNIMNGSVTTFYMVNTIQSIISH